MKPMVLPRARRMPMDLALIDGNQSPPTTNRRRRRRKKAFDEDGAGKRLTMFCGEQVDDGGMLALDFRTTAEALERSAETRARALADTDLGEAAQEAAAQEMAQRADNPLVNPGVQGALGWLLRLDTDDVRYRLLGVNRRLLSGLGMLYRDTNGEQWTPVPWPTRDRRTGARGLGGLDLEMRGNGLCAVVGLRLRHNNLVGRLPRDLTRGGLGDLATLDLGLNPGLIGGLPGTIAQLPRCTRLDLGGCSLDGPLPPQLALMASLTYLDLGGNAFEGPPPARLVDCARLTHLDLSGNRLEGRLPSAWGRLGSLRVLRLRGNADLWGGVPDEWEALGCLEHLDVRDNQLGGPIPPAVLKLLQPTRGGGQGGGGGRRRGGGSRGCGDDEEGGGGGGVGGRNAATRLHVCRLRGNAWDETIPRYPDGVMLNACTDLNLVDLPGTHLMTSQAGARRLLHEATTTGDVPPSLAYAVTARGGGGGGGGGGSSSASSSDASTALPPRALRPATVGDPRVVARTKNRYLALRPGGERVVSGFAALELLPAPDLCGACLRQGFRACLCVRVCLGCGCFNSQGPPNLLPTSTGNGGGGPLLSPWTPRVSGGLQGSDDAEREGRKGGGMVVERRRAQTAAAGRDKSGKGERAGSGFRCRGCRLSEADASKFRAMHSAAVSRRDVCAAPGLTARALLHPPQPHDLLRPPASQALDSADPYADQFPF